MDLKDKIDLDVASSDDMIEKISYMIWGSIITTTRGFGKVQIKIEPGAKIIFAKIELRWFVAYKKMKKIHDSWLKIANSRATENVPAGWRVIVYYGKK